MQYMYICPWECGAHLWSSPLGSLCLWPDIDKHSKGATFTLPGRAALSQSASPLGVSYFSSGYRSLVWIACTAKLPRCDLQDLQLSQCPHVTKTGKQAPSDIHIKQRTNGIAVRLIQRSEVDSCLNNFWDKQIQVTEISSPSFLNNMAKQKKDGLFTSSDQFCNGKNSRFDIFHFIGKTVLQKPRQEIKVEPTWLVLWKQLSYRPVKCVNIWLCLLYFCLFWLLVVSFNDLQTFHALRHGSCIKTVTHYFLVLSHNKYLPISIRLLDLNPWFGFKILFFWTCPGKH